MTANIRTPQRTVSAMQRFAVSQKNHAEAITISPFLLSLPYRTENRRFSALSCAKTGSTQPKLSAACFVQSCFAVADFVVFSNYCLIGTRPFAVPFHRSRFYRDQKRHPYARIPFPRTRYDRPPGCAVFFHRDNAVCLHDNTAMVCFPGHCPGIR